MRISEPEQFLERTPARRPERLLRMLQTPPSKNPPGVDALVRQWQADRDPTSRDQLFRQYRGFIRQTAIGYATRHEKDIDEAIQNASLGFLRAIDKYDPAAPATLLTYARIWMRSFMARHSRYEGMSVHPRDGAENVILPVHKAWRKLERKGQSPTPEALAAETGLSIVRVNHALAAGRVKMASIDAPVAGPKDDGGATTLGDTLPAPDEHRPDVIAFDHFAVGSAREAIEEAAERLLKPRDREIVRMRFWDEMTMEEVAVHFGLSRQRIQQIEVKVFETLTRALRHDRRARELLA